MQIGDIAYDRSVSEIVLVVSITEDENMPNDPVYKVITLDQSLNWEYYATMQVLEAL
tara:strand:+ start:248 stop:418 length:171 start_codon:yes stop_codon:yes gene_type:complete